MLHMFKMLITIAVQDYRVFNLTSWISHFYFLFPTPKNLIHSDKYLFALLHSAVEESQKTIQIFTATLLLLLKIV